MTRYVRREAVRPRYADQFGGRLPSEPQRKATRWADQFTEKHAQHDQSSHGKRSRADIQAGYEIDVLHHIRQNSPVRPPWSGGGSWSMPWRNALERLEWQGKIKLTPRGYVAKHAEHDQSSHGDRDAPDAAHGIERKLEHALTQHDERRSRRPGYNPYALPQYLEAVSLVMADIKRGTPVRQAVDDAFEPPLLNVVLRALGEPVEKSDAPRAS